jgi:hypothetical protein
MPSTAALRAALVIDGMWPPPAPVALSDEDGRTITTVPVTADPDWSVALTAMSVESADGNASVNVPPEAVAVVVLDGVEPLVRVANHCTSQVPLAVTGIVMLPLLAVTVGVPVTACCQWASLCATQPCRRLLVLSLAPQTYRSVCGGVAPMSA